MCSNVLPIVDLDILGTPVYLHGPKMDDVPEEKWFMQLCKGLHIETCTYFRVFFKVISHFQMKFIFNSIVLS